jgi:hypothetical protein
VFLGSAACLCAGMMSLPSVATAASDAPRQVSAGCAEVDTSQASVAQSAAALRYWTPQRTAAAEGYNAASISSILRSSRGAAVTKPAQQCQPGANPTAAGTSILSASVGAQPDVTSHSFTGYPSVGKFFFNIHGISNKQFSCTASVINDAKNNPKRELILTAAHCIEGALDGEGYSTDDWLFAPMWNNNKFPYGKWSVKSYYIEPGWMDCAIFEGCQTNPKYDYAVLVVYPQHGHGVGYYTGENGWHINEPHTIRNTRIVGLPSTSKEPLYVVTTSTTVSIKGLPLVGTYLGRKAATPGFADGSSGGPWYYSFGTSNDLGLLTGDTGGYETGGPPSGSPSYSSFWTSNFSALVAQAAAHE